jgi:serine/threonine-protein kinase ATR
VKLNELELSPFLKIYMLGIVSNLNEMLQDVHGKKSFPEKKQILCSLEVLIVEIGLDVNEVSPQVHAFVMFL